MVRSGRFVRGTGSKSMRRQFAREGFLRRLARRPRLYIAVALPLAIPFILASVTNDVAVSQPAPPAVSRAAMIVTPLRYAELTAPAAHPSFAEWFARRAGPVEIDDHVSLGRGDRAGERQR